MVDETDSLPCGDPLDIETLAAVEHASWSTWAAWMLRTLKAELLERLEITDMEFEMLPCVRRWRRQVETAYADLSERERESDRDVVRKKLPIYRPKDRPLPRTEHGEMCHCSECVSHRITDEETP